jgi:hypothetical protein
MDKEFIIYIVFLIIALLGRLLGGKKGAAKRPRKPSSTTNKPVKSFEELLEEFTQGRQAESNRDIEELDVPASVESRRRRKSARELIEDDEREDVSEERPFSFEPNENLRSLDELVDIEKVKTKSSLQSPDEKEDVSKGVDAVVSSLLQSPEDAKKAIILSEILNRKYH